MGPQKRVLSAFWGEEEQRSVVRNFRKEISNGA
nr:MAG TPA: hypothetical protein [Caudoviricetes sp.]